MLVRKEQLVVGGCAMFLVMFLVGCGREPVEETLEAPLVEQEVASETEQPEVEAGEPSGERSPAEPLLPAESEQPLPEEAAEPVGREDEGVNADLAGIFVRLHAYREQGAFAEGRQLAIRTLEAGVADAGHRRALESLMREMQQFARQAPDWQSAIPLLAGNPAERRIARQLLLRGGDGARILMRQALQQASGDLLQELVGLLVFLDDESSWLSLLPRLVEQQDEPTQESAHLLQAFLTLLPDEPQHVTTTTISRILSLLEQRPGKALSGSERTRLLDFVRYAIYDQAILEGASAQATALELVGRALQLSDLSQSTVIMLEIARMDVAFLMGDIKGALGYLDSSLESQDEDWRDMVRNKLLAHLDEQESRYPEAIEKYQLHIDVITRQHRSIENPANGSQVLPELILGRNFFRVAGLQEKLPERENDARQSYTQALDNYRAALQSLDPHSPYWDEVNRQVAAIAARLDERGGAGNGG